MKKVTPEGVDKWHLELSSGNRNVQTTIKAKKGMSNQGNANRVLS